MKLLSLVLASAAAIAGVSAARVEWWEVPAMSFTQFTQVFHKQYESSELAARKAAFESAKAEIVAHNAAGAAYRRTLVASSDSLKTERAMPRGVHKAAKHLAVAQRAGLEHAVPAWAQLPAEVDWVKQGVVPDVRDQGQCGSCYAHGALGAVEAAAAIAGLGVPTLSVEQVMVCAPNPEQCGGTGGCAGGTAEVVYDYVKTAGVASEWTYPYTQYWGTAEPACKYNNQHAPGGTPAVLHLHDYVNVPTNNYTAVMHALATVGPLAISVDASKWSDYAGGVYTGCNAQSTDIDHEVLLVGYGTDQASGLDYWLVQNSWGTEYGEKGFIRVARSASPSCGVDKTPQDGTGCKNGPSQITVCGECGILFDAVYPIGVSAA